MDKNWIFVTNLAYYEVNKCGIYHEKYKMEIRFDW